MVLLIKEETHGSNIQLLYEKPKKDLLREVYLLARSLMLNWSRRRAFIYATKTWNLYVFLKFFESFRDKSLKKYILQKLKNGLSLRH